MSIPFTQYLMPDGRQKSVTIDRPSEVESVAADLIREGCVFEIEMLRSGEISMTCELGDVLLGHELCPNGPEVPSAVDKMIKDAAERLAEQASF